MNEIEIDPRTAAVVIAVVNGIGAVLKRIPEVPNRFIPLILAAAGSVGMCMLTSWSQPNVINGIGLALAAVGIHQSTKLRKEYEPTKTP